MFDSNILAWAIFAVLAYGGGAALAFLCLFKPEIFVRYRAGFYRNAYENMVKMTDEQIDRSVNPIWFFFMIDSMSNFVNRGVEHPEEFPRMILQTRALGCFLGIMVGIAVFFLLWGFFTGGLQIVK